MKEQSMSSPDSGSGLNEKKGRGTEAPRNQSFYMRVLCLILIVGAIFFYNDSMKEKERDAELADLTEKVQELENQQQEMLTALEENYEARKKAEEEQAQEAAAAQEDAAAQENGSAGDAGNDADGGENQDAENQAAEASEGDGANVYRDGTYTGDGQGFGGNIQVQITIENDTLKDIQVLSAPGEDSAYLSQGEAVIDSVLSQQSTDVDTVSGATFSSTGILMAIEDALGKAENE